MQHNKKRSYSAAFVAAFLAFVTVDIFYDWTVRSLHWSPLVVRVVEGLSLLAALALFVTLMGRVLPSGAVPTPPRRDPLVKHLKDTSDPLLLLRIFAFFCVIVTHCFIIFKPEIRGVPWGFLLRGCGPTGMVIFFCLSGYLMGKAFYSGRYRPDPAGIKSFYLNRALRIVPLTYFASFVVILFVSPNLLQPGTIWQLWRPLLFMYYGYQPGPIGVLWATSVEMQYYLIAPFLFILLAPLLTSKPRAYLFIAAVAVFGIVLKYSLYEIGTDRLVHRYTPLLTNFNFFLVGFAINPLLEWSKESIKDSRHYKRKIFAAFLLCPLIYLMGSAGEFSDLHYLVHGKGRPLSWSLYYEFLMTAVLIMTFFCVLGIERYKLRRRYLAGERPRLVWLLGNWVSRPLQIVGVLTFGLYVWHQPVLTSLGKIVPQTRWVPEYLLYCAGGLLLVLSLALTTYFVIERPSENYKA